ncbi:TrmH family RNA methyltransferase [Rasiella sp. SM2506]|uniref:TrmH family RNA methyltransferase n=1 Tax=Rasiella sp. SM2506 TaxID=3423914 RepID=UPI003D7B1469
MLQHTHESTPFSAQKNTIVLLCDGLQSPANLGAIFRLCDAFGVAEVIFNTPIDLSSNRLKRTARNTEKTVTYSIVEDLEGMLLEFQQKNYSSLALEISSTSVPLSQISTEKKNKIALVIGNERTGVSEKILQQVQHVVHIKMFGTNSSMNVAQATAIALYELIKD